MHLSPPKKKKKRDRNNNNKKEKQPDSFGRDDSKEEAGKKTGKITNKMLNTYHLDNIKVNQKHDLKKKRGSAKEKMSVINNQASDEQVFLSLYRMVPTDCEVQSHSCTTKVFLKTPAG